VSCLVETGPSSHYSQRQRRASSWGPATAPILCRDRTVISSGADLHAVLLKRSSFIRIFSACPRMDSFFTHGQPFSLNLEHIAACCCMCCFIAFSVSCVPGTVKIRFLVMWRSSVDVIPSHPETYIVPRRSYCMKMGSSKLITPRPDRAVKDSRSKSAKL